MLLSKQRKEQLGVPYQDRIKSFSSIKRRRM
jgi:hypothetical protein